MRRETHTIDATDKILGRLAVEVACLLRGKQKPTYVPHKDEGDIVLIQNIDQIKVTGKKFKEKVYYRHTGFPGGFKQRTMEEIVEKKGFKEVFRMAVSGMMPKNKLRRIQIKRLKFK